MYVIKVRGAGLLVVQQALVCRAIVVFLFFPPFCFLIGELLIFFSFNLKHIRALERGGEDWNICFFR